MHEEYVIQPGTFTFGFALTASHTKLLERKSSADDCTDSSSSNSSNAAETAYFLHSLLARSKPAQMR